MEGAVHFEPVAPLTLPVESSFVQLEFSLSGARNKTEELLLKSLHAHDLPCYHHILGGLLPHFRNTSLELATRMYLRPGVVTAAEPVKVFKQFGVKLVSSIFCLLRV